MKMIIASGLAAIMVMSALVYNATNDKIEAMEKPEVVEQEIEIEKPTSRKIPVTYIDMTNELTSAEPCHRFLTMKILSQMNQFYISMHQHMVVVIGMNPKNSFLKLALQNSLLYGIDKCK